MFPLSVCVPSHCRYSIERVFRPRKLDRAHPRELLECAFDIITPVTNSLLPDAETIYTISEIVQEFPALQVTTTCESVCVSDDAASRRCRRRRRCSVSDQCVRGWLHHCSLISHRHAPSSQPVVFFPVSCSSHSHS